MMNLCINQNEINELNHSHSSLTLTVPQMAKELNISRNTAYELTKQKGFPCFRVGKRVLSIGICCKPGLTSSAAGRHKNFNTLKR